MCEPHLFPLVNQVFIRVLFGSFLIFHTKNMSLSLIPPPLAAFRLYGRILPVWIKCIQVVKQTSDELNCVCSSIIAIQWFAKCKTVITVSNTKYTSMNNMYIFCRCILGHLRVHLTLANLHIAQFVFVYCLGTLMAPAAANPW